MECKFFFWFALCLGGVKPVWKLRRQQSPLVLPRSLVLVVIEQLQGRVRTLSGPNHSICRHCSPWEWVTVLNIHKTQARHRHRRASPDQHLSCVCFLSQHTLTSVHFSGLHEPGGRFGRKVGWNRSLLRWTNSTIPCAVESSTPANLPSSFLWGSWKLLKAVRPDLHDHSLATHILQGKV